MPTPSDTDGRPGPIEPSETRKLASRDGTALHAEWFPVDEERGTALRGAALIVHGYLEHCGRYHEVAHVLNHAGLAVLSFDLRGHGRSDGQRGFIQGVEDYLDDMDAALDELVRRAPDLPVVLVGHSNGGLLVMRHLSDPTRTRPCVERAVLSSPFLGFKIQISAPRKLLAQAASRWFPTLSLPSELELEWLTSDPEKQGERRLDTLCHEVATARWYTATIAAQEYVADFAARVEVPTLWLVAAEDKLADPAIARMVHGRLRPEAPYHHLVGWQHEVFNETERGHAFQLLDEFVRLQPAA